MLLRNQRNFWKTLSCKAVFRFHFLNLLYLASCSKSSVDNLKITNKLSFILTLGGRRLEVRSNSIWSIIFDHLFVGLFYRHRYNIHSCKVTKLMLKRYAAILNSLVWYLTIFFWFNSLNVSINQPKDYSFVFDKGKLLSHDVIETLTFLSNSLNAETKFI